MTGIIAGVSNNRKEWIEGISECITFSIDLQVDDKQPTNETASMSPHCGDPFNEYYQSD